MIYPYSIDGNTEYYFLTIGKYFNRKKFLKKVKVKKGFHAEKVFGRIYDELMSETIDIQREYRKYYGEEYGDIGKFLYQKFNIRRSLIDNLIEEMNKGRRVLSGSKYSSKDYVISQLIFSETMLEELNMLIL